MTLRIRTIPLFTLLLSLLCLNTNSASAATPPDHWVGTWAASPLAEPNTPAYGSADTTLREIVHVSLGGSTVRIILSNEFGLDPLTIGAVHIALSTGGSSIDPTTSTLTFSGSPSITIPSGALVVSDPVNLSIPAFANLAVSLFIPAQTIRQLSVHSFADQTNYEAPGNAIADQTLTSPKEIYSWPFLKGVDVEADKKATSVVAFGDSITDGAHSTRDANARWPDVLARRLQANKKTAQLGVLNEGIGGNRILHDGWGPNALSRFDRDVLAQSGVKYLIILESINDIGNALSPVNPHDPVTAQDLITGLTQLATRAHTHGIKVFGATLTPYVGAKYASPGGEKIRQAVNQWIRTTNQFDGVIDFDKATRDTTNPEIFSTSAGSVDSLHPGDSGYKLMGDSIDLKLFTK